jgi:hypothetical protein
MVNARASSVAAISPDPEGSRIHATPTHVLAARATPYAVVVRAARTLVVAGCGGAPRVALAPLPLQDDDHYDIPEPPFRNRDDYYDLIDYTVFTDGTAGGPATRRAQARRQPKQALNATLDEVRGFQLVHESHRPHLPPLPEAIAQGPNRKPGPDLTSVAKTAGVTRASRSRTRGDRFVIKFDPKSDPELATGAEAISTRLWALGYNTPENYLRTSGRNSCTSGRKRPCDSN